MRKAIILFFILVLTIPTVTHAQSAKDAVIPLAVMALKKLEARTQEGVTYRDYGNALGDAKIPLNLYFESPDAVKYPELSRSLHKAMAYYDLASRVWDFKMGIPPFQGNLINAKSDLGKELEKLFPNVITDTLSPIKIFGTDPAYDAGRVLRLIWKEASKEVYIATKEYAKLEEKPSDETTILKKEISELKEEVAKLKAENDLLRDLLKGKKAR